ncbi:MAG TPA: ATP-binding protein [Candidatus Limnocylindrales bacterium]|nr:ATP-binding protein [Candidatus Limnocylindrales bacterium]
MTADEAAAAHRPAPMGAVDDDIVRQSLDALVDAQKMEAIGLLVAGVAHELNNPLASIVAFSQLIRSDPNLPADLRTQADLLVQEANRTRVIVQNLLDFARQRPPERVRTELRPLVERILALQSYVLSRNQITAQIDIADDVPALLVDRGQIQQVLVNLTFNSAQAIHAAGRSGTIRIQARRASSGDGARPTVRIAVIDDGPGVSPDIANRLFLPFATTKAPGEGTGLGLSVSFGIVTAHGGTLRHERNGDGGATFVVELPVESSAPADPAAPTPAARPSVPLPPDDARGALHPRILVLDDEPAIREFLSRALVRYGYEPVLASTGPAALEIVRADPPAGILCDHRMAGMSGTEFHAAVSEIVPALSRRFAFMSGDVLDPQLRAFATDHGIHLLAKPFDLATVERLVGALLAEPA